MTKQGWVPQTLKGARQTERIANKVEKYITIKISRPKTWWHALYRLSYVHMQSIGTTGPTWQYVLYASDGGFRVHNSVSH